MRRFFSDMHPMLRGFLIIAAIALVVVALQLQATLTALFLIAQVAFFLAIAFFLFLMWRERRGEIGEWPGRAQFAFYGGALLAVADVGIYLVLGASGADAAVVIVVLALCAFSMWRVWRDQHRLV